MQRRPPQLGAAQPPQGSTHLSGEKRFGRRLRDLQDLDGPGSVGVPITYQLLLHLCAALKTLAEPRRAAWLEMLALHACMSHLITQTHSPLPSLSKRGTRSRRNHCPACCIF